MNVKLLWKSYSSSFPDNNCDNFDSYSDEYFLDSIVTFKMVMEIIDGQQHLTTLMFLLCAFYDKFKNMKDDKSKKTRKQIEQYLWKTDEFGDGNKLTLKIDSKVATDNDKDDFLEILRTGVVTWGESSYVENYKFFQDNIIEFTEEYISYTPLVHLKIM